MTDEIRQVALDDFEGWFDGDAARMERTRRLHLVRTSNGWRIADALWQLT